MKKKKKFVIFMVMINDINYFTPVFTIPDSKVGQRDRIREVKVGT